MTLVVNSAATVMCSHGGTVALSPSQQKLTAGGQAVLVDGDFNGATISGCTLTPSSSTQPCQTVTSMLSGAAQTLTVAGKGVILQSAQGITSSTPPGTWSVSDPGQSALEAT